VELEVGPSNTIVLVKAQTCNDNANALASYFAGAEPVTLNGTGSRYFGTDERGTIFQNTADVVPNPIVPSASIKPVQ
jgi:hypothetical protein